VSNQTYVHGRRGELLQASAAAQVHMTNLRYVYQRRPGWQATPRRPSYESLVCVPRTDKGLLGLSALLSDLYMSGHPWREGAG
jgi:hypothetical protein